MGVGYSTALQYILEEEWLKLPKEFKLGEPVGLALDGAQNLIVFHRAGREWPLLGRMPTEVIKEKTILVIDRNSGKLLKTWGDNLFIMPHGLAVDDQNNVWVTDVGLHQIFKFNPDGKLLMKIGEAGVSGNNKTHFNKPTDVAIAKDGSFYVADGYGNSRIVKFSANGNYLFEWGKKGTEAGSFDIPHSVSLGPDGNVYVADRENKRIQMFESNGKFIKQIQGDSYGAFCAVAFGKSSSKLFAVDDHRFLWVKHRGSDVFVFDTSGKVATRFGRSGPNPSNSTWYHDLAIDKDENIYVADILNNTIQKFQKLHR